MWSLFNHFISPKKFFRLSSLLLPWMTLSCALLFIYGLIGGLWLAPSDAQQGDGFRIIYVHVPCAFLSLFVYACMAGAAFVGIVWRIRLAFLVMRYSAPIGALFTFLALVTGSLWGKPMWGTWWIWDARLTSELILLFLYCGVMLFQSAMQHKRQGDRATAILVLVGFIDIPIIHYSVYWWNTLHQGATIKIFQPSAIAPEMLHPLLAMIAAFALYYAIVLFMRLRFTLIATDGNHHWLEQTS